MRVAILGYGRIGHVHEQALTLLDGVELVAAGDALPVEELDLDAVVVATPTSTHAEVVRELRRRWPGRIVVEKPVAITEDDVESMLDDPLLDAVYHAAYAPEVEWAVERMGRWVSQHGPVNRISMAFGDPYAAEFDRATATLGDSWLDGGINALSVLARFAVPERVLARRAITGGCSTFEAVVTYDGDAGTGEATILTTWSPIEPSKSSRLAFADGTVVALDHQAVSGRLERHGRTVELFASPVPAVPRLVQHYLGAFARLFVDGHRSFAADVDRQLHRLLLSPDAGGRTPPRSTGGPGRTS